MHVVPLVFAIAVIGAVVALVVAPVRLEWGAFNARYRVISPDRGFVAALLDLALMTWLVDEAPRLPLTYEIQRDQVLCRAPGLAPKDVAGFVNALPEFARRIS